MRYDQNLSRRQAVKKLSFLGTLFGLFGWNAKADLQIETDSVSGSPDSTSTPKNKMPAANSPSKKTLSNYMSMKQGMVVPRKKYRTNEYEAEIYGPGTGKARILFAESNNKLLDNTMIMAKMPKGTCYGEHHHTEAEVVFVVDGDVRVDVKNWQDPSNPFKSKEREFKYQISLNEAPKVAKLSNKYQTFLLKPDGWIDIPGYASHMVTPATDSRILAYLPSAKRQAEEMNVCAPVV